MFLNSKIFLASFGFGLQIIQKCILNKSISDKPPSTETAEEEYPFWVTQKSGKRVPIVQSSAFTKYFGKLIVTLNDTGAVVAAEGNSILLDHTHAKSTFKDSIYSILTEYRRCVCKYGDFHELQHLFTGINISLLFQTVLCFT